MIGWAPWYYMFAEPESFSHSESDLLAASLGWRIYARPYSDSICVSRGLWFNIDKMMCRHHFDTVGETMGAQAYPAVYAKTDPQHYVYDLKTARGRVFPAICASAPPAYFAYDLEIGNGIICPAVYTKSTPQRYDTEIEAATGAAYQSAYAKTRQTAFGTRVEAADVAGSKGTVTIRPEHADHATELPAAFHEAATPAILFGSELEHEITLEAAQADTFDPIDAAHRGAAVSDVVAAEMVAPQSVSNFRADGKNESSNQITMDHATPAGMVQPAAESTTKATGSMLLWFIPKIVDGALYIRSVCENPEPSDDIIHIT